MKELENKLNIVLQEIISSIQKEYPLTIIQKIKIASLVNSDTKVTINSSNNSIMNIIIGEESNTEEAYNYCLSMVVKNIFSLIIESQKIKNCSAEIQFSKYITSCMVEFYTFKYCVEHNINYTANQEYILFFKQLIDGFSSLNLTTKEIENTVFRSSINSLVDLSSNGTKLFQQFKEDLKQGKIYTKKEM